LRRWRHRLVFSPWYVNRAETLFGSATTVADVVSEMGMPGQDARNLDQKEWAEHSMRQPRVDDLDEWWRHVEELDLPKNLGAGRRR
jgi:hypothetical protein